MTVICQYVTRTADVQSCAPDVMTGRGWLSSNTIGQSSVLATVTKFVCGNQPPTENRTSLGVTDSKPIFRGFSGGQQAGSLVLKSLVARARDCVRRWRDPTGWDSLS